MFFQMAKNVVLYKTNNPPVKQILQAMTYNLVYTWMNINDINLECYSNSYYVKYAVSCLMAMHLWLKYKKTICVEHNQSMIQKVHFIKFSLFRNACTIQIQYKHYVHTCKNEPKVKEQSLGKNLTFASVAPPKFAKLLSNVVFVTSAAESS